MTERNEQETTVTGHRRHGGYLIWTADPVHIRTLDKRAQNDQALVLSRGDGWAEYSVQADTYDPVNGFKRAKPKLSDTERLNRAERLRIARETVQ